MEFPKECVAVVAGGTGSVGEGLVRSLMQAGGEVVVPYRNVRKKNAQSDWVSAEQLGEYIARVHAQTTSGGERTFHKIYTTRDL
jgi:predicted dinucleotide-binding enzyme